MALTSRSADTWLPSWTPKTLAKSSFFHFKHFTSEPASSLSRDAKDFLISVGTVEVRQLNDAGFIVVDNDIDPTDMEYLNLLSEAEGHQKPILTISDVEFARRVYVDTEPEVTNNLASIKNVGEYESDGQIYLTFGDEILNSDVSIEDLHHEILLRDPIVRDLARNSYEDLESMVIRSSGPPRIVGTRWTIEDAQNDYLAEAWRSINSRTWIRQWNPEEFNKDYMGPKGRDATDVVYAALWIFFDENRKAVESRMPSETLILPVRFTEDFFPEKAEKHMKLEQMCDSGYAEFSTISSPIQGSSQTDSTTSVQGI